MNEVSTDCYGGDSLGAHVRLPGTDANFLSQMSVFSRPRSIDDAAPRDLRNLRPDGHDWSGDYRVLPAESRLLLSGGGKGGFRVYAVPTAEGEVCWQLTEAYAGGCSEDGSFTIAVYDWAEHCHPLHAVGAVPDRVRAVDVVVSGRRHRAQLGENAFFYEHRDARASLHDVSVIVFHFRDGSPGYRKHLT